MTAAEVWQADISSASRADGSADRQVYLDLVPERDFLALTPGVGLQVVDDCSVVNGARQDDGYIGYNTVVNLNNSPTRAAYGGVILFDSYGRLTCQTYGFHIRNRAASGVYGTTTPMGDLLYYDQTSSQTGNGSSTLVPSNAEVVDPGPSGLAEEDQLRSQFGIVLFDAVAFKTAGGNDTDPQLLGTQYTNSNEVAEENWLDTHGTPLLVDRFNGTLNTTGQ